MVLKGTSSLNNVQQLFLTKAFTWSSMA